MECVWNVVFVLLLRQCLVHNVFRIFLMSPSCLLLHSDHSWTSSQLGMTFAWLIHGFKSEKSLNKKQTLDEGEPLFRVSIKRCYCLLFALLFWHSDRAGCRRLSHLTAFYWPGPAAMTQSVPEVRPVWINAPSVIRAQPIATVPPAVKSPGLENLPEIYRVSLVLLGIKGICKTRIVWEARNEY